MLNLLSKTERKEHKRSICKATGHLHNLSKPIHYKDNTLAWYCIDCNRVKIRGEVSLSKPLKDKYLSMSHSKLFRDESKIKATSKPVSARFGFGYSKHYKDGEMPKIYGKPVTKEYNIPELPAPTEQYKSRVKYFGTKQDTLDRNEKGALNCVCGSKDTLRIYNCWG